MYISVNSTTESVVSQRKYFHFLFTGSKSFFPVVYRLTKHVKIDHSQKIIENNLIFKKLLVDISIPTLVSVLPRQLVLSLYS